VDISYWSFKALTLCGVAVGLEWIHHHDLNGKPLLNALMLVFPYLVSLALPKKWLGLSIAIPIGAALVLLVPLLPMEVFMMGYNHNWIGDPRLFLIFLLIVALAIASFVTATHNRPVINGWVVLATLIFSVFYYAGLLHES
jgi:hypothetical protein